MEGILAKTGKEYILYSKDKTVLGITSGTIEGRKLSLKNCQAIERGYDLDELAEEVYPILNLGINSTTEIHTLHQQSLKEGFQKALELMSDKKFSEEDMLKAIAFGWDYEGRPKEEMLEIYNINLEYNNSYSEDTQKYIQSLQQTEWDVEIEQELIQSSIEGEAIWKTKLDADGCLILKRKENGR